jgi:secretion/DNA translocation related TadE-like protein
VNDRGSATLTMMGLCFALVLMTVLVAGLVSQLLLSHSLQGATDRAALGATDVLVGVGGVEPCALAADIVRREGFVMISCELMESSARVGATGSFHGLTLSRRAHATIADSGQK